MQQRLGLKYKRRKWSETEDAILKSYYASSTARQIGELLGRSEGAVRNRQYELNLVKYPGLSAAARQAQQRIRLANQTNGETPQTPVVVEVEGTAEPEVQVQVQVNNLGKAIDFIEDHGAAMGCTVTVTFQGGTLTYVPGGK